MLTRIISGVLGIALAVLLIHLGGLAFFLGVLFLAGVGLYEFFRMVESGGTKPFTGVGILSGLILICIAYFSNGTQFTADLLVWGLIGILFIIFVYQLLKCGTENAIRNVGVTFFGVFYVGGLMAHFILLRNLNNPILSGEAAIWFGLVCTWSTDSMAYFIGRAIGKKPLAPKISPKKSVEGFFGGFFGSILGGYIFSLVVHMDPLRSIVIAAVLGIVGQVGDLFESALKRDAGIKDSGKLIPGHGGVLDRFDSAFFTLTLTYYLVTFLLK